MSYFDKISLGMLFSQGYLSPAAVLDLMEQSAESTTIRSTELDKKTKLSSSPAAIGPLVACCKA